MRRLKKFNIDEAASEQMSSEEIKLFLSENSNGFIFQKVIERARHYSDLAEYYLEASYICEEIAGLGKSRSFKVDWNSGYHPVAQFVIVPQQSEKLHELLFNFSHALSGENEDEELWWIENLEEYKENIRKKNLKFPELADDYFANLINGAYNEYESNYDNPDEFRNTIAKETPEHLFGFWKCMHSGAINQDFYVSTESWIIPPASDFTKVLQKYSSIKDITLENGNMFSLNGEYYVINQNYVIKISFASLAKAFQCIGHVFNNETTLYEQHEWLYDITTTNEVKISDFANFVLFTVKGFNVVLWNQTKLTFNDINLLNQEAAIIFNTTSKLIGLANTIACPWEQLTDEAFELLCYDIIYYNPKFDNTTIRKIGKSRSRDGGRDIVVYTKQRLGYTKEKYIIQCKLIKPAASLTAKKVLDISDIIEQYEANGYGVFTSGVIDATLYDKIDAICKRKKIGTELFSIHEIERELARYPKLKDRYFKIK
jgi:hypothetical protein